MTPACSRSSSHSTSLHESRPIMGAFRFIHAKLEGVVERQHARAWSGEMGCSLVWGLSLAACLPSSACSSSGCVSCPRCRPPGGAWYVLSLQHNKTLTDDDSTGTSDGGDEPISPPHASCGPTAATSHASGAAPSALAAPRCGGGWNAGVEDVAPVRQGQRPWTGPMDRTNRTPPLAGERHPGVIGPSS